MQLFVDEEEDQVGTEQASWAMSVTRLLGRDRSGFFSVCSVSLSATYNIVVTFGVNRFSVHCRTSKTLFRSNASSSVGPRVIPNAPGEGRGEEGEKLASLCRNHRAKNAINFVCKEIALAHSLITSALPRSLAPSLLCKKTLLETSPSGERGQF